MLKPKPPQSSLPASALTAIKNVPGKWSPVRIRGGVPSGGLASGAASQTSIKTITPSRRPQAGREGDRGWVPYYYETICIY